MIPHFYSLHDAMPKEGAAGGRTGRGVCTVHDVTLPACPGAVLDAEQQTSLRSGLPSSLTISAQASGCLESAHTYTLVATHARTHTATAWLRTRDEVNRAQHRHNVIPTTTILDCTPSADSRRAFSNQLRIS